MTGGVCTLVGPAPFACQRSGPDGYTSLRLWGPALRRVDSQEAELLIRSQETG